MLRPALELPCRRISAQFKRSARVQASAPCGIGRMPEWQHPWRTPQCRAGSCRTTACRKRYLQNWAASTRRHRRSVAIRPNGVAFLAKGEESVDRRDDKQVSPRRRGCRRGEGSQPHEPLPRQPGGNLSPQMSPQHSIYDLFKVVFARSAVMLKEHFRCVGPIIEYSKREILQPRAPATAYAQDLRATRPPLIDVLVEDGYRTGDVTFARGADSSSMRSRPLRLIQRWEGSPSGSSRCSPTSRRC